VSSSEIAGMVCQMIRQISSGIEVHPTDDLVKKATKTWKKSSK